MKYTKEQYIDAMYGYFGPDEEISNEEITLVKTLTEHQCVGDTHKGTRKIAVREYAICEKSISYDWVSRYVCLPCADKWLDELEDVGGEG
jgi:hypothetical protein